MFWWRVQPSLARANTPRHAAKLQHHAEKASWLIHWHMAHADGAYASVPARSPSLHPETIGGNLRGLDEIFLECTWTSVRAFLAKRLCDRDGGFVAARSHASPDRLERTSRKRAPPECFCFEKTALWQLEEPAKKNEAGRLSAAAYPLRETRSKRTPLYSLIQFRRGFELQPPPLSDTTLAERLPLRIPGTTITHSGPQPRVTHIQTSSW